MSAFVRWLAIVLIGGTALCALIAALSGCGLVDNLHYVPVGETPPAGSVPIVEKAAAVSDGWVGSTVQMLAGAVGAGGLVAAGRKVLRDRARKAELARSKQALREVVTGVDDLKRSTYSQNTMKQTLGPHQSPETRRLVSAIRTELKDESNATS